MPPRMVHQPSNQPPQTPKKKTTAQPPAQTAQRRVVSSSNKGGLQRRRNGAGSPRRMPREDVARARSALADVAVALKAGDDAGALRTLSMRVGDLVSCGTLAAVAAEFDDATRHLTLTFAEEFSEKAASFETERKRTLLALVEDIKAAETDGEVDAAFRSRRGKIVELGLLEHVTNMLPGLSPDDGGGKVLAFMTAVRDRLAQELEVAVYGDAALALRDVLGRDDDDARLSALEDTLRRYPDSRDQLEALVRSTLADVGARRDLNDAPLLRSLQLVLDRISQGAVLP